MKIDLRRRMLRAATVIMMRRRRRSLLVLLVVGLRRKGSGRRRVLLHPIRHSRARGRSVHGNGSLASSDGGISVQVARAFGDGVVSVRAEGGGGRRGRSAAVAVGSRGDLLALLDRLKRVLLSRGRRSVATASGRSARSASCLLLSIDGGLGGVVWRRKRDLQLGIVSAPRGQERTGIESTLRKQRKSERCFARLKRRSGLAFSSAAD
jgi:hypothetical protein